MKRFFSAALAAALALGLFGGSCFATSTPAYQSGWYVIPDTRPHSVEEDVEQLYRKAQNSKISRRFDDPHEAWVDWMTTHEKNNWFDEEWVDGTPGEVPDYYCYDTVAYSDDIFYGHYGILDKYCRQWSEGEDAKYCNGWTWADDAGAWVTSWYKASCDKTNEFGRPTVYSNEDHPFVWKSSDAYTYAEIDEDVEDAARYVGEYSEETKEKIDGWWRALYAYMGKEAEEVTHVGSVAPGEGEGVRLDESWLSATGPAVTSNSGRHNYSTYGPLNYSYLYDDGSGFTRVEYIGGKILVERYDDRFHFLGGKTMEPELPLFGCFYAGETYNYMVFGQENMEENDQKEVYRLVRYDKNFNRIDSFSVKDCYTTIPFDHGSCRIAEKENIVSVYTCRQRYMNTSDGLRHQSNILITVDMNKKELLSQVGMGVPYHVSHSFNQYVLRNVTGKTILLDHGDAYPRTLHFNGDNSCNITTFPGKIGNNTTGCSVGGLAETTTGYVVAYNQNKEDIYSSDRQIYLAYIPRSSGSGEGATILCLPASPDRHSTPLLAPTSYEGGYLLWNTYHEGETELTYTKYDAEGKTGEIKTAKGIPLSDCQPVPYGDGIVWYAGSGTAPTFYFLSDDGIQKVTTVPDLSNRNVDDWARESVAAAISEGLVPRNLQNSFKGNITREDFCRLMVTLIERVSGKDMTAYLAQKGLTAQAAFWDTESPEVAAAYTLGIVKGVSDTEFNPLGSIKRAEAATMLTRTAKELGITSGAGEAFSDAADFPDWAREGIAFCSGLQDKVLGEKVMGGTAPGVFSPDLTYTFEQAYVTSLRLLRCKPEAASSRLPDHNRTEIRNRWISTKTEAKAFADAQRLKALTGQ